jgi:hypothetical protein
MSLDTPNGEADSYLRFEAVKTQTGLSRTTIHRLVKSSPQASRRSRRWLALVRCRPLARRPARCSRAIGGIDPPNEERRQGG